MIKNEPWTTGLRTYFVSGRKSDQESTTETTVWLDETLPSMSVTLVGGGATAVTFAAASSTSGASSSKKKANSMPSILDDMAAADSGSSHPRENGKAGPPELGRIQRVGCSIALEGRAVRTGRVEASAAWQGCSGDGCRDQCQLSCQ